MKKQYEYMVVKIPIVGIAKKKPQRDYGEVINEYANDGWRLHTMCAPGTMGFGDASAVELVFERKLY